MLELEFVCRESFIQEFIGGKLENFKNLRAFLIFLKNLRELTKIKENFIKSERICKLREFEGESKLESFLGNVKDIMINFKFV